MSDKTKYVILHLVALMTCVVPPILTTLYHFPIWIDKGTSAIVSGLSVFLLFLCCIPFIRSIREYFKSPSAKMLWFIGLVIFWLIRTIVDEMIVICAVGFLANLIGTLLFKWRDKYK